MGIAAFERTIELQFDHAGAYGQLIRLLEAAGRLDEAMLYRHALDDIRSATGED